MEKGEKRLYILVFVFFLIIFFLFLFPYNSIKDNIFSSIEKSTGFSIYSADVSPTLDLGIELDKVTVFHPAIPILPITVDSIRIRTAYLSLLKGKIGINVHLDGIFSGNALCRLTRVGKDFNIELEAKGINIAKISRLKDYLSQYTEGNVDVSGKADLDAEIQVNPRNATSGNGRASITVDNLRTGKAVVMGFRIPGLRFSNVDARVEMKKGRVSFKKIEIGKNRDPLFLSGTGDMTVKPPPGRPDLNMQLNIRMNEVFREIPSIAGLVGLLSTFKKNEGDYSLMLKMRNGQMFFPEKGK